MMTIILGWRSATVAACIALASTSCASSHSSGTQSPGVRTTPPETTGYPSGRPPLTRLSYLGPVGLDRPFAATTMADLLKQTATAQGHATPFCGRNPCWSEVHLTEPTLLVAVIPIARGCFDQQSKSAQLAGEHTLRITLTYAQCKVGLTGGGTQAQPMQELYGIPLSALPRGCHLDVDVEVAPIPGVNPTDDDLGTAGVDLP